MAAVYPAGPLPMIRTFTFPLYSFLCCCSVCCGGKPSARVCLPFRLRPRCPRIRQPVPEVVEQRPAAVEAHADDALCRVVVHDLVAGRDDVTALAVDESHARVGLHLGAAFVEIAGPAEPGGDDLPVLRIDESIAAFVLDADQPLEDVAHPAVAVEAGQGGIGGRRIGECFSAGRVPDPLEQRLECRIVAARRPEPGVVVAQRDEAGAGPAQVLGPQVVVREAQLAESVAKFAERFGQPFGRYGEQRLVESAPLGQPLEDERRGAGTPEASTQRSSSGRIRYSVSSSVLRRAVCEAVRSTAARAAGERGMKSSQCAPCHEISASAKRVVRIRRGMPSAPVAARASVRVASDRSGVCRACRKIPSVGVMAIRF